MKFIIEVPMYAIELIGTESGPIGCAQLHGHERNGDSPLVTLSVGPYERPIAIAPMTITFARELATALLAECNRIDPKGLN